MLHVEILRNEWSAGRQRVLARLSVNGGAVRYDGDEQWEKLLPETFHDPATGESVLQRDGVPYLNALHRYLNGDYVFATEAHEEGECEFEIGAEIPLEPAAGMTPTPVPTESRLGELAKTRR
jgi:hypothetical protein